MNRSTWSEPRMGTVYYTRVKFLKLSAGLDPQQHIFSESLKNFVTHRRTLWLDFFPMTHHNFHMFDVPEFTYVRIYPF